MKRVASVWLLAALVLGLVSCSGSKPSTSASTELAPRVEAAAPAAAPRETGFLASGPIMVENQVDVSAQRDGVVAAIYAEVGKTVHQGELLAKLDDRQLSAQRDAAEAKLRSGSYDQKNWEAKVRMDEVDLDRAEKMMAADLITKEQLEHARFKLVASRNELEREKQDYVNAQASLRALQLEFEKTQIRAPFDGIVARRYVRVGQKASQGDRLFWVTATGPLRVRFTVPERFFGSVSRGTEVDLTSVLPDQKYKAKIIEVSPVVDPASGTFEVTAQLVGDTGQLHPGMSASIRLTGLR